MRPRSRQPPTSSSTEGIDDAAHRDASHVTVDIVQNGERLMVTVEDDGIDRTSQLVQLADGSGPWTVG